MRFIKRVPCECKQTTALDVEGREHLVLAIKATYAFPETAGAVAAPAEVQQPLIEEDQYFGEPGFSAVRWETDFSFRKAKCDVVLQGFAYAPGRKPTTRVPVGLRVGRWEKSFDVVGYREWQVLGMSVMATDPAPFTRAEFHYGTAFGGVDKTDPDDELPHVYMDNHVGLGFVDVKNLNKATGVPLPNTEEHRTPVKSPTKEYLPMAFGPLARSHPVRARYAGTYDDDWTAKVFPFLPKDFDERYFQCVGEDQQIDPPAPGTEVLLGNLTPEGRTAFKLPETAMPVRIFAGTRRTVLNTVARPDTLAIDAEARTFTLTWRVETPIKRSISEFTMAWVGPPSRAMLRSLEKQRDFVPMEELGVEPD